MGSGGGGGGGMQEGLTASFSRGVVVFQQWPWPRQMPDGGGPKDKIAGVWS